MHFRIFRAFAWLRWRVLLNSFERQGARDWLERFSVAIEQLLPVLVVLFMVPSALALAATGGYAGWLLAHEAARPMPLELLRFVLLAGTVFAIVGPIVLPPGERANILRFLLLPIPRGVLYVTQAAAALADPWQLLIVVVVASIPIGLAAAGAMASAALVLAAGLALLAVLAGLAAAAGNLVQLAVRDRRRGEVLALVFMIVLPLLGIVPGLLSEGRHGPDGSPRGTSIVLERVGRTALNVLPSEIYTRTARSAATGGNVGGLLALAGMSAALHGLAFGIFTRLLSVPASAGSRTAQTRWGARLPGVAAATSAVAIAQLKLGLRTPRGRSTILSPLVLFMVLAFVMLRGNDSADLERFALRSGIGVASFTTFVALLSIVPFAMNQFAIDRAGLTMMLLAPIETRSLLAGKAIGNGLIAGIPAGFCLMGSLLLFPEGRPELWLAIPLAMIAIYLLAAPAAAALSAVFPKTVDLNTIGRSNAHGAAGLLGTVVLLAAALPCLLLALLATAVLDHPVLAPVFLLLWLVLCAGLSPVLFGVAAALFERRRETLAMLV